MIAKSSRPHNKTVSKRKQNTKPKLNPEVEAEYDLLSRDFVKTLNCRVLERLLSG